MEPGTYKRTLRASTGSWRIHNLSFSSSGTLVYPISVSSISLILGDFPRHDNHCTAICLATWGAELSHQNPPLRCRVITCDSKYSRAERATEDSCGGVAEIEVRDLDCGGRNDVEQLVLLVFESNDSHDSHSFQNLLWAKLIYTISVLQLWLQTWEDQDLCDEIVGGVLQEAVCHRSALLTQVFAVTKSLGVFTMLSYNELANGMEVVNQYENKDWIVYCYLDYIHAIAIQSLRNDEALTFPVTTRWADWSVNFKTLTWHYNPAFLSLNPPSENSLQTFPNHFSPLYQDTPPRLNATEILAHVEETFGDFLYLIASGGGRWFCDLSNYAQNGLLTFGAVTNDNRPGILAHFPYTPSPELFCESISPGVKASYSSSDPTTHPEPAYLFVLPLHTELINGLHCVQYPFPQSLFYWSSDPHGRDKIAKEDWEKLGIPKLRVWELIGSYWDSDDCQAVREVLHQKKYDLDGKQYARNHGHPELILGDPHNSTTFKKLEPSESNLEPETPTSPSRLTSPSAYSLVEAPPEFVLECEDVSAAPMSKKRKVISTLWVKGFLNKYYN
ncbi:hypothetical protein PM082_015393 [Marasmius tenuissimus]|nr:hypothetical protein PM082_015393 [Marasmius tenuissimus]